MSDIEVTWVVWTDQLGVVYERRVHNAEDQASQLARGPLRTEHGYCIASVVVARIALAPVIMTVKAEAEIR